MPTILACCSKQGLGEAARAEAKKAVDLSNIRILYPGCRRSRRYPRQEPVTSRIWTWAQRAASAHLARTLTHDLLGRHFRPGMDWAGAATAYAKALELDPADVARHGWIGQILLEHDEDGLRYAPGTRLEDAIDEYRKAQRQLGPRNRLDALEVNLATVLLCRGEVTAELEKLAAPAGKSAFHEARLPCGRGRGASRSFGRGQAGHGSRRQCRRPSRDSGERGRMPTEGPALRTGLPRHMRRASQDAR